MGVVLVPVTVWLTPEEEQRRPEEARQPHEESSPHSTRDTCPFEVKRPVHAEVNEQEGGLAHKDPEDSKLLEPGHGDSCAGLSSVHGQRRQWSVADGS